MSTSAVSSPVFSGPSQGKPAPRSHLRITRRGRVVFATIIAFPLAFVIVFLSVNGGGAAASTDRTTPSFQYVTVQDGQSLWGIAEQIAPQADPRTVIAGLMTLNDLGSGVVMPGERLAIPSQYDK